jgi:hypothetical protein
MATYFEGDAFYHRYDNCPLAIRAKESGKRRIYPIPKGTPVCNYCELMGKITPAASLSIDEKAANFREELLDRAIRIAAEKGYNEVTPEAVERAESEYFDEVLREIGEDLEADLRMDDGE